MTRLEARARREVPRQKIIAGKVLEKGTAQNDRCRPARSLRPKKSRGAFLRRGFAYILFEPAQKRKFVPRVKVVLWSSSRMIAPVSAHWRSIQ
jgi:hypothetical protein